MFYKLEGVGQYAQAGDSHLDSVSSTREKERRYASGVQGRSTPKRIFALVLRIRDTFCYVTPVSPATLQLTTVRRERRWSTVGVNPTRELVRSTR